MTLDIAGLRALVRSIAGRYRPTDTPTRNGAVEDVKTLVALAYDTLDEIERLQAEVQRARRTLAEVRGVHQQYRAAWVDWGTCAGCNQGMELVRWPCPTIRALDAEGADRG